MSFLFPETVPRKYSLYMRLMTRLAVRAADRIIAVSEATKRTSAGSWACPRRG